LEIWKKACCLERSRFINSVEDGLLIDVHNVNDQTEVEVNVVSNGEPEASRCLAVQLTLVAELVDAVNDVLVDVLMSCLSENLV